MIECSLLALAERIHVRVEPHQQRVEGAVAEATRKVSRDFSLTGEIEVGSRRRAVHPAPRPPSSLSATRPDGGGAARLLGISRTLAYRLVERRDLPAVRLGRRLVVPRRALEWLMDVDDGSNAAS